MEGGGKAKKTIFPACGYFFVLTPPPSMYLSLSFIHSCYLYDTLENRAPGNQRGGRRCVVFANGE